MQEFSHPVPLPFKRKQLLLCSAHLTLAIFLFVQVAHFRNLSLKWSSEKTLQLFDEHGIPKDFLPSECIDPKECGPSEQSVGSGRGGGGGRAVIHGRSETSMGKRVGQRRKGEDLLQTTLVRGPAQVGGFAVRGEVSQAVY